MKTKIKSKAAIDNQQALNEMLADAMKQPGVAVAMQLVEAAEKYSQPAKGYSAYIDWHRFPILSTNCCFPADPAPAQVLPIPANVQPPPV